MLYRLVLNLGLTSSSALHLGETVSYDGGEPVTVQQLNYNAIGQLSTNDLGAFTEAYTYNVRGAMTGRKSDVFEQNILFTGKFNGSIASINDKLADGLSMTSWYTYDKAGRLTQANMKVGGTPRYVDYTYDLNGNITSLVRDGDDGIDPIAWIDNMTYRYDGNKVRKISDHIGDIISERTMDFPDLADLDVEYSYDRNGNMTWDANKGLKMRWDANNRLDCAYYNPGVLSFTRSATGRRLSRSYSPNQSVALEGGPIKKGRSYADFPSFGGFDRPGQTGFPITDTYDTYGSYEYENGAFSRLNTTTGYRDSVGMHVYVRDWQGNIRAVVRKGADGKAILEQATYYYPYGMPMAESTNPTANRYKYTGKELLTDYGVNILDYGPRPYDPTTGLWLSVDPKSMKYISYSHYTLCLSDPINYIDLLGLEPISIKFSIGFQIGAKIDKFSANLNFGSANLEISPKGSQYYYSTGLDVGLGLFSFSEENKLYNKNLMDNHLFMDDGVGEEQVFKTTNFGIGKEHLLGIDFVDTSKFHMINNCIKSQNEKSIEIYIPGYEFKPIIKQTDNSTNLKNSKNTNNTNISLSCILGISLNINFVEIFQNIKNLVNSENEETN